VTSVDTSTRQLVCKVLFAGPLDAGVGTTFRELHAILPGGADGVVIPGADDPPVYELKYRPRPLIRRQGLDLVLHLVGFEDRPAGEAFDALLDGVDALVVVVDSNPAAVDANRVALQDIEAAFGARGSELDDVVVVLQYNKRDLADALPIRSLESALNGGAWPYVATSSHRAQGLQQLLDRVTSEVARRARPPRSWTSGRSGQLLAGSREPQAPSDEAKTQLHGRPRASDAFLRADQRLFGRGGPERQRWADPDEDSTVLAEERPAPGSEITSPPLRGAPPDEPRSEPPPPPAEPVAVEAESGRHRPAEATRPHTSPPGSVAPPSSEFPAHAAPPPPSDTAADSGRVSELRRHAGPTARDEERDSAPWDGRRQAGVASPAAELVHVRVPVLGRHRPTALGKPVIRGPRTLDVPFTATVEDQRQDVVLRIELGTAGAPPNVPRTTAGAPRAPEDRRMVPLSWLVFTAGLLAVVLTALVLGSLR